MFRLARLPESTRSWHSGTNERLDTASLVSRRRIATHVGLRSIRREWCHERRASSTTVHPRNPDGRHVATIVLLWATSLLRAQQPAESPYTLKQVGPSAWAAIDNSNGG